MKSTDVAKEFQQTGDDPRQYRLEVGLWASSRAVSPTATVVTLPSPAYCLGLRKSTKTFTIICEADQRSFYQHTPSILCWKSETGLNMVASKILPEAYHGLRSSGAFVPPSPGPMYACYNLRHHRMPPSGPFTFPLLLSGQFRNGLCTPLFKPRALWHAGFRCTLLFPTRWWFSIGTVTLSYWGNVLPALCWLLISR
jgi:hypothetical protein